MDNLSPLLEQTHTTEPVEVIRLRGTSVDKTDDTVAQETPIGIEYNGVPFVVMLATPQDLEDFAVGFSLTEGIVKSTDQIKSIVIEELDAGIRVAVTIDEKRFAILDGRRQNLAGRTGCGLCGTERIAQVFKPMSEVKSSFTLSLEHLHRALEEMKHFQPLQQITGATHAAFWVNARGQIMLAREDVGRHNALDKLYGAMASHAYDFENGAVLVTSRASYEMVQKTVQMGVGILVAVSGPTALAIRMADEYKLTLMGFTRSQSQVIYTHPERVIEQ
ncbi:MAG: formate dehydrogenase accessory sulfurtransferase FdhD [Betaproteobacteria bacterium]|nr:formate dehydrogenase accessory sulfurtransferase FdhD [Betaproteobacteria bacterium]MDE2055619.1 formate dehydrogenase accessory sulfurtransferase FdhD [Betaproteobacteria bacterium]